MDGLYSMTYMGNAGAGTGACVLNGGGISGFDILGGRYQGTYSATGGQVRINVTLTMDGGGTLVTGQSVPAGQAVLIAADLPADFGNGKPHQIDVLGQPVLIQLRKMADVP